MFSLGQKGIDVSHQTILRWAGHLGARVHEYASALPAKVGKAWRTDEMHVKIKGEESYLYCIMDDRTRFWLNYMVSSNKGVDDVRPMFAEASYLAGFNPVIFISDGAPNFAEAARLEYRNAAHIQHIHIRGDRNNNKMERFIGRIRSREKTMRSLKRPDSDIVRSIFIHYNFVRKHMGLGLKTPAHAAGIMVRGVNKWKTLIQNAAMAKHSAMWPVHAS